MTKDLEEREIGGLGIFMVKKSMDDITYEYKEGQNILRIKKYMERKMDNSIFRKKSIERISSPEQLGDYIRVSNPSVWIILGAIIVLLAGACVWGIFGTIETRVSAPVVSDGESVNLYLDEEEIKNVNVDMELLLRRRNTK